MFSRLFSDSHAWVAARLSAYIDEQLTASERARVDAHLRDCVRCQSSLKSLQWTIALVKQAPAPTVPRAFTLPVHEYQARDQFAAAPARTRPVVRTPSARFVFPALRLSTALATVLLVALVGIDLITQFGGADFSAAPVAEKAALPTQAALAPQGNAAPATLPQTAAPTTLPQPAAPPATPQLRALPTAPSLGATLATPTAPSPADTAAKIVTTPTAPPTRAAIAVPTAPRVEATRALPAPADESPRAGLEWLRIIEFVLLAVVMGLWLAAWRSR